MKQYHGVSSVSFGYFIRPIYIIIFFLSRKLFYKFGNIHKQAYRISKMAAIIIYLIRFKTGIWTAFLLILFSGK